MQIVSTTTHEESAGGGAPIGKRVLESSLTASSADEESPLLADDDRTIENDADDTKESCPSAVTAWWNDLSLEEVEERVQELSTKARELHVSEQFSLAAETFAAAADGLEYLLNEQPAATSVDRNLMSVTRLHEALCHLKAGNTQAAIAACNRVLEDKSANTALRARALYRRAKAWSEMEETALALQDAKEAAFMGDRKGVELYGQLLRQGTPESPALSDEAQEQQQQQQSMANSFLAGLTAPQQGSGFAPDFSDTALLQSFLQKSLAPSTEMPDMTTPQSPFSMFGSAFPFPFGGNAGGGNDPNLAQSVMSSLSKRIGQKETQQRICDVLGHLSVPQVKQYAGMMGMDLSDNNAERISGFCQSIEPKHLQRTVSAGRGLWYTGRIVRKTSQVMSKYKNVILWVCILGWIRSAVLRPYPVRRTRATAAVKAATTAATATNNVQMPPKAPPTTGVEATVKTSRLAKSMTEKAAAAALRNRA